MAAPVKVPMNTRGGSLVEVMVALTILTIAIMVLGATSVVASQSLRAGRGYAQSATVAQGKLDSLRAMGWAALAGETGSDNVAGVPVAWAVVGTNPRAVVLIVQRQTPEAVQADTFVTYVAE